MASRTQVILISDLSGDDMADGGETIDFSYRGADYTIDLSEKEAKGFDKAIAMYVEHAQKRSKGRQGAGRPGGGRQGINNMRRQRPPRSDRQEVQAVREWLRANDHQVSDRGRIKAELMDLYNASH